MKTMKKLVIIAFVATATATQPMYNMALLHSFKKNWSYYALGATILAIGAYWWTYSPENHKNQQIQLHIDALSHSKNQVALKRPSEVIQSIIQAIESEQTKEALDLIHQYKQDYAIFFDSTQYGGCTPLHFATNCNNIPVIKALIEAGASPLTKIDSSKTDYHNFTSFDIELAKDKPNLEVIKILLSCLLNPELKETMLHKAVEMNHPKLMRALLYDTTVDINAQDWLGNTALFMALRAFEPNPEIITMLLQCDADATKMNNHTNTPLELARTWIQDYKPYPFDFDSSDSLKNGFKNEAAEPNAIAKCRYAAAKMIVDHYNKKIINLTAHSIIQSCIKQKNNHV